MARETAPPADPETARLFGKPTPVPPDDPVDELAERVFVLREALRDLLHLDALENAGLAGPGHYQRWRQAIERAADVLGEVEGDR